MALHEVVANAGAGGSHFGANQFTDTDTVVRVIPYSQLAYGADGSAPTVVTAAAPLPVVQTGALPVGTNSIGTVQPGNTANTTPWLFSINAGGNTATVTGASALKTDGSGVTQPTSQRPATSGGLTTGTLISAATTNATSLKASAGQVYHITAFNNSATLAYLKLYNKASAPTVGTDTPVMTFLIPGNANGAGLVISDPNGFAFSTGIAYAITGLNTTADTTAVAANQITLNIGYA